MNDNKTFLDKMREDNKFEEFKDFFKALNTDRERVIFTLKYMSQHHDLIPSTTGMPKNAKKSEELQQRAFEIFNFTKDDEQTNTTLIEILKLFTQSIAFAPYPSKQLAFGYALRALVLLRLHLYSDCIKDIDRALKLTYLDDQRAQLYLRKAECLIILGKYSSVEDILKKAQYWLDKMSFSDPDKKLYFDSKLDILRRKALQTEQSVTDNNSTRTKVKKSENKCAILSHNAEAPCASDAVAIEYSEDYGRHLIATRDIKPGEIIAVEKPYALLLSRHNVTTHCSNCLKVCWANIPCDKCTYAMYCSKKCRNDEWKKYHDVECAIFPILVECGRNNVHLLSVRLAVLALREAENDIEKLQTMIEEIGQYNKDLRTKNFSHDGKLQSDKYVGVYNLLTHIKDRDFEDLFMMSWNTCIILHYLAARTKIFKVQLRYGFHVLAKIGDITFLGGLILRHQQILTNNLHTFSELQDFRHLQRGSALMSFCSLINHSCDPNILRQTRSKHIVLHAIYPIQKGQQLFDSYGPYYIYEKRDIRKQKLKKQYFFECNCFACQKDLHFYELPSYMTLVEKKEDKDEIEKALKNLDTYYDLVEKDNVDDKLYIKEELLEMIQILHNYTTVPCSEAARVIITLRRIYAFEGNRFKLPQIPTRQT